MRPAVSISTTSKPASLAIGIGDEWSHAECERDEGTVFDGVLCDPGGVLAIALIV